MVTRCQSSSVRLSGFAERILETLIEDAPVVSGQPKEQGGDVFDQSDTVRPKYDRNVSITIAEIVPLRSRRFTLPINERILRYTVACFREKVLTS